MKKPGERVSVHVRRGKCKEGPLTSAQERNACIDGNAALESDDATIILGTGKKKQGPAPAVDALMPITNMTEQDEGASFIIGVGGNAPKQQPEPIRVTDLPEKHPLTPQSLLGTASSLVRSVECLVPNVKDVDVWGIALLSAHALETLLKAFLLANGITEKRLKYTFGHNLAKAWREASSLGLDIPSDLPRWCNLLDGVHDSPYFLRYPPTSTGMILPNLNDLSADLRGLYELVQRSIPVGA